MRAAHGGPFGSGPAHAQTYPNRVIRIVASFPLGELNNNVARIVQSFLQEELGQAVIVESHSGASGIVGTDAIAKAAPDGFTVVIVAVSHTVTPATNSKLPYDTVHDIAAVGMLVRNPFLFVVNAAVLEKYFSNSLRWQNPSREISIMRRRELPASRIS